MHIAFTGGGTLGHIVPMLAVIKRIKMNYPNSKISYIASLRDKEYKIIQNDNLIDNKIFLDIKSILRKISFKNIKAFNSYFKSYKKISKVFKKDPPDIVVGMGGYISLPVLICAHRLKIPIIIHEQNSVLGLANRIIQRRCQKVLLSFKNTVYAQHKRSIHIGNPRASEVYFLYKDKNKPNNIIPKILIIGGSLGAKKLNDFFINHSTIFKDYEVTIITGKRYYQDNVDDIIKKKSKYFRILEFSDSLLDEIFNSDIIISRGGASTISEVMALHKRCILIPSPNVTDDHQSKNCLELSKKRAALVIKESDLNINLILDDINYLLNNQDFNKNLIKRQEEFISFNSIDNFLGVIFDIIHKSMANNVK